jgi:hypothetical protein
MGPSELTIKYKLMAGKFLQFFCSAQETDVYAIMNAPPSRHGPA